MLFKELINRIEKSENKRAYNHVLAITINKMIEKHIQELGKTVVNEYREVIDDGMKKRVKYHDLLAPNGFADFEGPTSIEIKLIRDKRVFIPMLKNNINNFYESSIAENIILVTLLELNQDEKNRALEFVNRYVEEHNKMYKFNKRKNIYIWDLNNLNEIFNRYEDYYVSLIENINDLLFTDTVEKGLREESAEDETYNNEKYIDNLKEVYKNDDLVLFVGAGISKDAGIAMWDTLIYELLVSLVNKELEKKLVILNESERSLIIDSIKNGNGNSPLQLVRFIRNGLSDNFLKTLTEVLYKNSLTSSCTLSAITNLCAPIRDGVGVQGIVTYNFDDLLEKNFETSRIKYRSIYRESDLPKKNEIGIFHVHGFLPREEEKYPSLKDSLLVFSEEGYHDLLEDAYHWANLIQLNYLRERTCLFIGVSLTDPNIRRLLEINMKKQPDEVCRHYLILKKEEVKNEEESSNINMKNIEKFQEINQVLKEHSLKELGINVIWIEDYGKDIPAIIKKIKDEVQ